MAPRALPMLTCFSPAAVDLPLPAEEGAHGDGAENKKRRWTDGLKRKILAAMRRPRIRAVGEEPCDVDVDKQKPKRKIAEKAASRRSGGQVSQRDTSPRDDGAPEAVAGAVHGRRKRKGLRVRFDLPTEEISAAPEEPRFPTGVLGEPPESLARSGPEMTAAFLVSFIADAAEESGGGAGSATPIDHGLVSRWTERKEACSHRLSYVRDYCPFQREDDEDEESAPETTLPAEADHAEEALRVKTGLPFDSPESEAEFVKAIRSRYLLKDDFIFHYEYERSRATSSRA